MNPETGRSLASRAALWGALALLLAAVLLAALPHLSESYWIDEIVTLEMAEKDRLADLLVSTRAAMAAPPLCHLLMRGLRFLGDGEWVGRLPSLLLALGTVLVCFFTARRLGGARMGLWTAVFAATSPLLLKYAAEARPYAHFIFLTSLMIYLVVRLEATRRPAFETRFALLRPLGLGAPLLRPLGTVGRAAADHRVLNWIALGGVALAGLYAHFYFAFVLLPALALVPLLQYVAGRRAGISARRAGLGAGIALALLGGALAAGYRPYLKLYEPRFQHLKAGGSKSETPVAWSDLGPRYLARMVSPGLLGARMPEDGGDGGARNAALSLIWGALTLYGAARLARAHPLLGGGLLFMLLFALLSCGLFLVGRNFFHYRYFVFQVPFYALFAAWGTVGLVEALERRLPARLGARFGLPAAFALGLLLPAAAVQVRMDQAGRLWGPPTGFSLAGATLARYHEPGDRVMILGPRSRFDENMFFSEHTEARYPLRNRSFGRRVGYLPTDPGMLAWALSGPGRAWLLRAYYAPWPPSVAEAAARFRPFLDARQCDLYLAARRGGEPPVLTKFHVTQPGIPLPLEREASRFLFHCSDRLPLVVAAPREAAVPALMLDDNIPLVFATTGENRWSEPVWIEPGEHAIRLAAPLREGAPPTLRLFADEAETLAAIEHPRDVRFGGALRFLGYDLSPDGPLAPGDAFTVTYYWRCEAPTDENLKLVMRYDSLHPENPRAWVRIFNDHAGVYGLHPTCDWQPGELVVERYRIRIPESHPEGLCALHAAVGVSGAIGSFDRRHSFEYHRYLPWNAAGEEVYTAGGLEISRARRPVFRVAVPADAVAREFSSALVLWKAELEPLREAAGDRLRLRLYWYAGHPVEGSYRYHVVLREPESGRESVIVRPPFAGLYPTYAWRPGETIRDELTLPLERRLEAAEVELRLARGDYDRAGVLQVGETLGAPVGLGRVTWSQAP